MINIVEVYWPISHLQLPHQNMFVSNSYLEKTSKNFSKRDTTISNQCMLYMPLNSDRVVLVKPPESTNATVSVPLGDQTASTSSGPESARANTSTNSACANTAQSSTSASTRNLFVVRKPLVVDALRCLKDNIMM
uniref:Uncharacterized protein n=1 Tax=Amphimedon queenslandica TaxID=400682 RepID=A0A1X7UY72_AMPQE